MKRVAATPAAQTASNHRPAPKIEGLLSSVGCLAVEPAADVLDRVLIEAGVKAARDVADVWGGQQVRQRAERMVERQRLLIKDIDGSTGDRPGFERGN